MDVVSFIHETNWKDLPEDVRRQARRCLLDTLGAGIGGSQTRLSHIIRNFAASAFSGRGAYLWLDGRIDKLAKMIWQCPDLPDATGLFDAIIKHN